MEAIIYHRYGSPDVLEFEEIPKPTPAEDQVLIRVHAASVNPYDWHFLRGTPSFIRLFIGMRRPKFPRLGADVAGVVEAVGAKAHHSSPAMPFSVRPKALLRNMLALPHRSLP